MIVRVVVVGRVKGVLSEAVNEYETRAARYWKLEVEEVAAGAPGRAPDADRVRAAEAERILPRIPGGFEALLLTREGKPTRSRALARFLEQRAVHATPGVVAVIGGAFGLDRSVLQRATRTLSLSAMTLPHELARLILAEQLYRAGTILRNEPYHKGG